jgi:predicted acylesterase/phospholipase RssA
MKRILSIDGGGIRGLIPAMICRNIEERTEKPLHETFDLIAGTSTGGIIALGLTRPPTPLSAAEIIDFYKTEGPKIFGNPRGPIAYARGPRYSNTKLKRALEATFGAVKVANALTNVLIPAYDLKMRQLTLVTRRFAKEDSEHDYKMSDVALGTSAAPTYFAPAEVKIETPTEVRTKVLIDGGMIANNPAALAIAEGQNLWPDEEFILVSIGTGRLVDSISYQEASRYSLIQWVVPVIDCMFDGTAKATEYYLKTTISRDSYWRFQPQLRERTSAMDDASPQALTAMELDTNAYIEQEEPELNQLESILKRPKTFRAAQRAKLTAEERDRVIESVYALSRDGDERPHTHALSILQSSIEARQKYNLTGEQLNLITNKVCAFRVDGDSASHLRGIKILDAAFDAQDDNYGINEPLISALMRNYLDQGEVTAMHAVDVLGPAGWTSPTTYRYLALQARHYVMKNMSEETWDIDLSEALARAISRCIEAARESGLRESATKFDNDELIKWKAASPRLEYSRTLFWTRKELLSSAGRAVIDIHNAFHIPLFFLETAEDDKTRDLDFIYLAGRRGVIGGFYGLREKNYKTEAFAPQGYIPPYIPRHRSMADQYEECLDSDKLMFAADAYHTLRHSTP